VVFGYAKLHGWGESGMIFRWSWLTIRSLAAVSKQSEHPVMEKNDFCEVAAAALSLELGLNRPDNVPRSLVFVHSALDEFAGVNDGAMVFPAE